MNINRRQFAGMFAGIPFFPLLNRKDNKTVLTPSLREQWFDDDRIIKHLKINLESRLGNFLSPPENIFKLTEFVENCEFTYIGSTQYFLQADIDEKNLADSRDNLKLAYERLLLCLFPLREHLIQFNKAARVLNSTIKLDYQYTISDLRRFITGSNHSIIFKVVIFRPLLSRSYTFLKCINNGINIKPIK